MNRFLTLAVSCIVLQGCTHKPDFVGSPGRAYREFTALAEPRADITVGAFWIDKYGISGAGAAPDNVETIKGLSGITFDSALQMSLTVGLLQFLDLDPSYRRHVVARVGDISIVRVKDVSKLPYPEQPHVYAALKAATITITADASAGLDVENRALSQNLPIFSRGTTGLARTFTVDGRDLYFALRVARLRPSKGAEVRADLKGGSRIELKLGTARLTLRRPPYSATAPDCAPVSYVLHEGSDRSGKGESGILAATDKPVSISIAVPQGDGRGGLLTQIEVQAKPHTQPSKAADCSSLNVRVALVGTRLETLDQR